MATKHYPRFEMVDPMVAEALRALPGYKRLDIGFEMNEAMRHLLAAGFKSRHADWTEEQERQAVAGRMLDGPD